MWVTFRRDDLQVMVVKTLRGHEGGRVKAKAWVSGVDTWLMVSSFTNTGEGDKWLSVGVKGWERGGGASEIVLSGRGPRLPGEE